MKTKSSVCHGRSIFYKSMVSTELKIQLPREMTREDKTRRQHPARATRGAVQRYLYENVPQPIGTMTRNNRSDGKLKVKGAGMAEERIQRT